MFSSPSSTAKSGNPFARKSSRTFCESVVNTTSGSLENTSPALSICSNVLTSSMIGTMVQIIEDVRTFEQIDNAGDVFSKLPLVVFTTDSQKVREDFRAKGLPDFAVELGELNIDEVEAVLNHRWKESGGALPHPFDPQGIVEVFQNRRWALGAVMDMLSAIVYGAPPPAPASQLPFDELTVIKYALAYIKSPGSLV